MKILTKISKDMSIPPIDIDFGEQEESVNCSLYQEIVKNILKRIVPEDLFDQNQSICEQLTGLNRALPIINVSSKQNVPSTMSFCIFCKSRPNVFKFFIEMLSRWLVPGKRLNVILSHAVDFCFPHLGPDVYMVSEVMIAVECIHDLELIQRNLPLLITELKLGVNSGYYAGRILEVKGLSNDDKTVRVQEHIAGLIARYPKYFNSDLFSEMQNVLVMCEDRFKVGRESYHLCRMICYQYLFRNFLLKAVKSAPKSRHMDLKIFRSKVKVGGEIKNVLSIIIGINFLQDKEVLDEMHLIKGIQNYIPQAQAVENSFFCNRRGTFSICTFYIEIEKKDNSPITTQEIQLLRKKLFTEVEEQIEQVMHPVFMPRNEEEMMRNMLILSNQIKYIRDIPQVIITFDEQTHLHLFFTIILVRVLKPKDMSIMEMFKNRSTFLEYIHDGCKLVGTLRKKHEKEATIFRVKVSKDQFLRRDHSINLYEARQAVVSEISRIVGEIRDFNGGMISKQNELLLELKNLLSSTRNYNEILLENFFYSLKPVIMRTFLEVEALKSLFLLLVEAIEERFFNEEVYTLKIQSESDFALAMVAAEDWALEEELQRVFKKLNYPSISLASFCVRIYEASYIGYIYRCDDFYKQRHFFQAIQQTVEDWDSHKDASSA
ncbi:hypothetical protein [Parachlamydia acanthamoebae]|uniref:hypothetical protein n=1 Tax=Parachlamydia acanthamoebae TaxID=83552 RepID=UPI000750E257|nr:hypothetical protein [Parachlamydia acanthamoebae]